MEAKYGGIFFPASAPSVKASTWMVEKRPFEAAIDVPVLIATTDPKTEQLAKGIFSNVEITHKASAVLPTAKSVGSQIVIMDLTMPKISASDVIQNACERWIVT